MNIEQRLAESIRSFHTDALAWRKKNDEREMYLLVEGETFSLVAKIDQTKGMEARQFAAAINTASEQAASGEPIVITSEVPDVVGKTVDVAAKEVMKLKLRHTQAGRCQGQTSDSLLVQQVEGRRPVWGR